VGAASADVDLDTALNSQFDALVASDSGAQGSFSPRRGVFGWSRRVRWSVAVSIVLLVAVVAGAVVIAQLVANNREAEAVAASVSGLESAEADATEPYSVLESAIAEYEQTVVTAQAAADSAGPALASVVGMADEPALAAANSALAELVAALAESKVAPAPEPYTRGDVDMSDPGEIATATDAAASHAALVSDATREARDAQAVLVSKMNALLGAQVTLGSSLPARSVIIVGTNSQAEQSFRDAVLAAALAVGTAQKAGGSGDAELLAYSAAVTALRADQARAEAEREVERPVVPEPEVTTEPEPLPEPVPEPEPVPTPTPTPTGTAGPEEP
jgi:hypothetical protein